MTSYVTTTAGDTIVLDRHDPTTPGDGPAVVLVAGAGPFRAIDPESTALAEHLATGGRTAVVADRLGRGDSFRPGRVGLADEVAALRAVLAEVGPAVLVGHSSGAAIALHAAVAGLPVAGLVLFEAPLDPAAEGVEEWVATLGSLLDAEDHEGAVRHYMKDIPLEILADLEHSPIWEPFVRHAQSLRPDAEVIAWTRSAAYDVLLGGLEVPVRALVGEETFPEMPVAAAAIAAAVPGASQGVVAGAQHTWDPAAMAVEVLALPR